MNYQNIYSQIIEKRKLEEPEGYTEMHHIIPRSLGGSDDKDNLVKLTAREHFICHYLLAKIYSKESLEWYKMNHAFMMMKCQSITHDRYYNSRLYESLRGNFSSIMSVITSGGGNSQYGTMWICNVELRKNRKIKKDELIPDGWVKGRNVWNKVVKVKVPSVRNLSSKFRCSLQNKKYVDDIYHNFIHSGCSSLTSFSKSNEHLPCQSALTRLFNLYIPEYFENSIERKSFLKIINN